MVFRCSASLLQDFCNLLYVFDHKKQTEHMHVACVCSHAQTLPAHVHVYLTPMRPDSQSHLLAPMMKTRAATEQKML